MKVDLGLNVTRNRVTLKKEAEVKANQIPQALLPLLHHTAHW